MSAFDELRQEVESLRDQVARLSEMVAAQAGGRGAPDVDLPLTGANDAAWFAPYSSPGNQEEMAGGAPGDDESYLAGPGIQIEEVEEEEEEGWRISVRLAEANAGLEMDQEGNEGSLRVKPNAEKGVAVSDDGVEIVLTPEGVGGGAGLEFGQEIGEGLQVKDGVGLTRDGNILEVLIAEDGSEGLRFELKELRHAPPGVEDKRFYGWVAVDKFGHVVGGGEY